MNNYYDESIANYVLNSPHPELILYCDGTPINVISFKDEGGYLHKNDYLANDHGTYEPEIQYLKPELAVCECCGAPLHGNKCEYCGSTYIWR